MADTESTKTEQFTLNMRTEPPEMAAGLNRIISKALWGSRTKDLTIVNPDKKNASIKLSNHNINQSSSPNVNRKMTDSQVVDTSMEEKHVANRLDYKLYDLAINDHKLNPNLWEFTDFKYYKDQYGENHAVGAFSISGTVLTPSWDHQLHKYVLVRRRCRMPLFSPINSVPEILKELNIADPTKVTYKYGVKPRSMTAEEYYEKVGKQYDKNEYATDAQTTSNAFTGQGEGKASNAIVEKGIQWCIDTANDNNPPHLYSQSERTGPSYDCTGFISSGLIQGGLDIPVLGSDGFNSALVEKGFKQLDYSSIGKDGLKRGDILDNGSHVEWYIGGGQVVGAHTDSKAPADQISVENFYPDNWVYVLRLE